MSFSRYLSSRRGLHVFRPETPEPADSPAMMESVHVPPSSIAVDSIPAVSPGRGDHQSPMKARPPHSTASTDTTAVDGRSATTSPERASVGKRKREGEEEVTDETADDGGRPSTRPRTESYVQPEDEPPSLLGWFMLPWQAFKRGFAEGIWPLPSSSAAIP